MKALHKRQRAFMANAMRRSPHDRRTLSHRVTYQRRTSSRSPNCWEVSWPQVPNPGWVQKSNRAEVDGDEREQHQDRDGRMQLTTRRKS